MVPVASTPSISTRPLVGSSNPAMILKMVLLPQPDGPIRLTKRPCGIDSVTGASAWKAPVGVLNVMLTSATQSFGAEDDMRTPRDGVAARMPPIHDDYIAKAVPATMGGRGGTLHRPGRVMADGGKLLYLHQFSAGEEFVRVRYALGSPARRIIRQRSSSAQRHSAATLCAAGTPRAFTTTLIA